MLVELCRDLGGNDLAGGLTHVDEFSALGSELFGDKLLHRDGREARIADVLVHIGVGKFLGLDHDMESIDGVVAILCHGKVLHDIEHGQRGDALAIGGQLIDSPATVGGGDGLNPLGLEVAEVFQGVSSSVGIKEFDHGLGHGTVIESIAPMLGELAQGTGESGVPEEVARRRSSGPDVVGLFVAGLVEQALGYPVAGIALSQGKSVLRIVDGGCEELAKGQSSEAGAQGVPSGDGSRDVDGLDADGVDFGHSFGFEVIDGKGLGGPAAGVQAVDFAGLGLVIEDEEVSADAIDVGLDDPHDGVGRDGGVDGVATLFEDVGPCL